MTEHVKGCEHDKWKAMVDSVIEFLSASRTMLHVLNERISEREKLRLAGTKKIENEKTKLELYKERLCSHIGTDVNEDGDIQPSKVECTVYRRVKGSGDKAEQQTTNRRSKSTSRIRERSPKLGVSDGSQTYEEPKLHKGSATHLEQGVGVTEKICELTVVVEEDQQSEKNLSKTERALSKLPKASRIPRTKSFNEGKSKYSLIDKPQNEELKVVKIKKSNKDVTYSKLHKKARNSKGDFFKVE